MPSEEKWYALTGRIANSASRDSQLPSERFSTRPTPASSVVLAKLVPHSRDYKHK